MKLKKVIIAPDSFKGVLSAKQATDIIASEISVVFPDCEIVKMPIADGGEGSVETILSAIGGAVYTEKVRSPDDRQIDAFYGISNGAAVDAAADGVIAIIEMAQSSGITKQDGLHPMTSTTYGFGQLIHAALGRGAREFILCIGGSATTDGGCGMAAALGVRFFNKQGGSFIPCGETLCDIDRIDVSEIDGRIAESVFTVMCDVDNPLFGLRGAAYIYGPQKGADPEQVKLLDDGLRHYGSILMDKKTVNLSPCLPGAGAAGGLGLGCIFYLNARLMSGIEAILELCDFEKHRLDADLIITGEGKLDSQSFQGKVLSGILQNAGDVPVWSICGVCDIEDSVLRERGVTVFETSEGVSIEESMSNGERYLREAVRRACESI